MRSLPNPGLALGKDPKPLWSCPSGRRAFEALRALRTAVTLTSTKLEFDGDPGHFTTEPKEIAANGGIQPSLATLASQDLASNIHFEVQVDPGERI